MTASSSPALENAAFEQRRAHFRRAVGD